MDNNTFEYKFSQQLLHFGEKLEKMSFDNIINIYKNNQYNNFYTSYKEQLIICLIGKYVDLLEFIKEKDITELVSICNKYNITIEETFDKNIILLNIMNYVATNMLFKL